MAVSTDATETRSFADGCFGPGARRRRHHRSLAGDGMNRRSDAIRPVRRFFQHATRDELVEESMRRRDRKIRQPGDFHIGEFVTWRNARMIAMTFSVTDLPLVLELPAMASLPL